MKKINLLLKKFASSTMHNKIYLIGDVNCSLLGAMVLALRQKNRRLGIAKKKRDLKPIISSSPDGITFC